MGGIVVIVIIIIMCESVSAAQSVGGGTGSTMTQQTEEEAKTNTGNMATDRTLLELEPSCPVGTSGTAVNPGVIEWSLTLPQQLNADSVGLDSQGSIYSGETRPWTLMLNSVGGQFSGLLQLISGMFSVVFKGLPPSI